MFNPEKTQRMRHILLLGGLLIILLLGSACQAQQPPAAPAESEGIAAEEPGSEQMVQEPIVLGAYASSTGVLKAFGSFEAEGWEIAEAHLNEEGGILGRPVEIRFQDDASDKDQARSIMESFVNDPDIIGVMGPTSSANAFASHPVAVQAGVPVVAISNNAQGILEQGDVIWRLSIPESRLLPVVVEQVVSALGIERAAILHAQDDPFSQSGREAYESTLKELDIEVVETIAYSSQTPDFGPQIRRLAGGEPQAVFVAAYSEDAGNFLRQARDADLNVPIIGNASFNSPSQLEIAGSAAEGLIIGSQWWSDDPDPLNQTFVKDYLAKFDRDPGNFSAMAYNGAFLIKQALEASGDVSREGLLEGLRSLEGYDLLGAPIEFRNRDAFTDEPIILMVQEGQFVPFDASSFQ